MSVFSKIKEAFVKSEDKDKYLSGLDRSKKSFGDRMRALSNNFHGIDDDLLEQIMVILLESDVGIHTAQKIVDAFESNGKHVKEYDSMLDYLVSILYDFYDESNDEPIKMNEEGPTVILMVGVNGSGKSTLLKLMTKIIYPNKGTLKTYGKLTSLLELGAGFHPDFTGRENIYFNAAIFGLTKQEIDARLQSIIDFSELGDFIDSPVRTYSSGMYMRLAFSVAINVDAEILLIDEILAVGDQRFQEKCFAKLEELAKSNMTIVIVSHSLDSISKLCNRAIWINNGEVAMDGKCKDVIEEYLRVCG